MAAIITVMEQLVPFGTVEGEPIKQELVTKPLGPKVPRLDKMSVESPTVVVPGTGTKNARVVEPEVKRMFPPELLVKV